MSSDAHLKLLADKHGVLLVTLDRAIPGAFLVPICTWGIEDYLVAIPARQRLKKLVPVQRCWEAPWFAEWCVGFLRVAGAGGLSFWEYRGRSYRWGVPQFKRRRWQFRTIAGGSLVEGQIVLNMRSIENTDLADPLMRKLPDAITLIVKVVAE